MALSIVCVVCGTAYWDTSRRGNLYFNLISAIRKVPAEVASLVGLTSAENPKVTGIKLFQCKRMLNNM
jgi:hypothetical protein